MDKAAEMAEMGREDSFGVVLLTFGVGNWDGKG
jgi:hypothetical protein